MRTCFIIMPISTPDDSLENYGGDVDHFLHVLDCLFIPAVEACGLQPILPLVAGSDIIHGEIIKNLSSADLVLCDMSQLNQNVFFEFGIRTALNTPVALVIDDITTKIPFDTAIINYHRYNSSLQGWLIKNEVGKLSGHINKTLESEPNQNSLWKYFGLNQNGLFNPDQITSEDKMSFVLRKLDAIAEAVRTPSSNLDLYSGDDFPTYHEALVTFKKEYLKNLLSKTDGNKLEAAKHANITRATLYRLLYEFRSDEDV